ncbi:MAG: hypothetical protein R3A13_12380 [Bdellovibrionota bacterium]
MRPFFISSVLTVIFKLQAWYFLNSAKNFGIELEDLLTRYLKKFPYWSYGHLKLAELSLKNFNPELAYASVLAFEQLAGKTKKSRSALGSCFLQYKDALRAKSCFEELYTAYPQDLEIRENLIACYLLEGSSKLVLETLGSLSTESLSSQERTALQWARGKL